MAAAAGTIINVPIYQINSGPQVDRNLYPYGMPVAFGVGTMLAQANSGSQLLDYQAGKTAGAALVYSRIKSSATGDTVWYSSLTIAQIITLAT